MTEQLDFTPIEYVVKKGWSYRKRAHWLDIVRCPFCHGGRNNDLHTFAIHSVDGNYICKRGSCNVSSSFEKLMEHFGDKPDRFYRLPTKSITHYVTPRTKFSLNIDAQVLAYLKDIRGFSEDTISRTGVRSDQVGHVSFVYYDIEKNEPCMVKFRNPRKHDPSKGERKAWREKNGKEVLWLLEKADPSVGPLVITFGEYDAMACVEAGIPNATSVPSGDDASAWIRNCWDDLERFPEIILWPDDDESGHRAMQETAKRLGIHKIRVVECQFKDANVTLWKLRKQEGNDQALEMIRTMVFDAPSYPYESVIRLVDVPDEGVVSDGVLSGIGELDIITGGFGGGGLTIWSGDNHAGKTTGILGLCVVEPVSQGVPTFVWSGEMKKSKIKYWVELIMAGPDYLEPMISKRTGREYWEVKDQARWAMRHWYQDLVYLYDMQDGVTEDSLFEAMEFSYKKNGCKNFVLDNLMVMVLSKKDERDEYRQQSAFVNRCKKFTHIYEDAHLHVVAHGRKVGDINLPPTKSDIKGASEISALADNAGAFWRVPESAKHNGLETTDTLLCWFKTRDSGEQANIKLLFDKPSKRFAELSNPSKLMRNYSWEESLLNEIS